MEARPTSRAQRRTTCCLQCRRRKLRCDRGRPCLRCEQANCVDQCLYDAALATQESVVPRQVIFAARLPNTGLVQQDAQIRVTSASSSAPDLATPFATPSASPSDHASHIRAPAVASVSSAQWLWHGSTAVDRYVEPFKGHSIPVPKEVVRGEDDTILHWGRSHISNFMPFITESTSFLLKADDGRESVLSDIDGQSRPKDLYHVYSTGQCDTLELTALLPPRQVSDYLISLYLNRFESYFRVLHIPTFLENYANLWQNASVTPGSTAATVLAVCAISSCLTDGSSDGAASEKAAIEWIEAVRSWLPKQDAKTQLTLGYLQCSLLTLIASEMKWLHIELSWVAAGTLVRNAIAAGLHREPSDFIRVSPFYAEIRRRLWYSIIEFDLSVSSKEGRLPCVTEEDFDCSVPSNLDDDMLTDGMDKAPVPAPAQRITQSTYQICVAESWPLRNKLCRMVNGINITATYEDVLKLDAEMNAVLRDASKKLAEDECGFARSFFMILICRPLFSLRRCFATRATHDPRYLYSRQACLETAIIILTDALGLDKPDCGRSSHFAHLVNICRSEIAGSIFVICQELLAHAVEQTRNKSMYRASMGAYRVDHPQSKMLLDLAERATAALMSAANNSAINQRMCSWLQLCVALSKAVTDNESPPAIIKEKVRDVIRTYHINIRNGQSKGIEYAESSVDLDISPDAPAEFGGMEDDYLNLFSNLNSMETISEWMLLSDLHPDRS